MDFFDSVWDRVAEDYATDVPLYPLQVEAIKPFLEVGCSVLDVGCGPSKQANHLCTDTRTYIGLDASEPMIRLARERVGTLQASPMFVRGSATALPFRDDSFSWAMSLNNTLGILPNWIAREHAVSEMLRVARRGCLIEVLAANRLEVVSSRLFRDRLGKPQPYRSARFTEHYFRRLAKTYGVKAKFSYVRQSTNFSYYFLAALTV